MRYAKYFLLYPAIFLVLLFGLAYALINSSYVFDKAAAYFAPQYDLRYDSVKGDAIDGISIEGLYYKDKKLAREIKLKLNPVTLLKGKITLSALTLYGVNESYLEYMISDLSSADKGSSEESFPFDIAVKDVRLTMIPFEISKIKFHQVDLRVNSIDYTHDAFTFGTLRLMAKTSLGRADIKGVYHGRKLHLSDLYIGNLDTSEIEKLLTVSKDSSSGNKQKNNGESPSIFIPKKLYVDRFKTTILPRKYYGINLSLLTADGKDLDVDLDHQKWAGDLNLSIVTDMATVQTQIDASANQIEIKKITLGELDLHKIISVTKGGTDHNTSKDTPASNPTHKISGRDDKPIPYIPSKLKIDDLEANLIPTSYKDINITNASLRIKSAALDIHNMLINSVTVDLNLSTDIADLIHNGTITNNILTSHITIDPLDHLIDLYSLPIQKGALKTIVADATTDMNGSRAKLTFAAKQILDTHGKKDAFNLDIDHGSASLKYLFGTGSLNGNIKADINTPYTVGTTLSARFIKKDKLEYKGILNAKKIKGIDKKLSSLLKQVSVAFSGDPDSIAATLASDAVKGRFSSKDLKKGVLHLESTKEIKISNLAKLPKKLQNAKAKIYADAPINLKHILPIHAKARIISNVIDMNADIMYSDKWVLRSKITIPTKSILCKFDKNIKLAALSPMTADLIKSGDDINIKISSKALKTDAVYRIQSGAVNGGIDLAGTHISVTGTSGKDIGLSLKSTSIKSLLKAAEKIYTISMPDISGEIGLTARIKDLKSATVNIRSSKIIIGKNKKTGTQIRNIALTLSGDTSQIILNHYRLETNGLKLYASKPSRVVVDRDRVKILSLWINDALKTTGIYNLKSKKGSLSSRASNLKINYDLADIVTSLGIKTKLNKARVSIDGKVRLQGGTIKYDMNKKSFATDSDIIVLQRQTKNNNSFTRNYSLNIGVESKKPLVYKMKNIHIKLTPHLQIKKRYGSLLKVYGKVDLLPGGYYMFEGKKFVLQKSNIRFRGKPTAPILDINIRYRHSGTTVNVRVTGTAADPALHFSSDPYMNREQILSFIMFDTKNGSRSGKAEDVTNLMAGTLVKSLFANMGLKLDHLVLRGSGFEVGKKISDKITVIYEQEEKSSIKIRIQNTDNIETDISFGANSRSADIYYKKEF